MDKDSFFSSVGRTAQLHAKKSKWITTLYQIQKLIQRIKNLNISDFPGDPVQDPTLVIQEVWVPILVGEQDPLHCVVQPKTTKPKN